MSQQPLLLKKKRRVAAPGGGGLTTASFDFEALDEGLTGTAMLSPGDGGYDEPSPSAFDASNIYSSATNVSLSLGDGATGSSGTGPAANTDGKYLYVESSGNPPASSRWYVRLPDTYDASSSLEIAFQYHIYSTSVGNGVIQWQYLASGSDETTGWVNLTSIADNQNAWVPTSVETGAVGDIELRFYIQSRPNASSPFRNDFSIDVVRINPA